MRAPVPREKYSGPDSDFIPVQHKWVYPVDKAHTIPHSLNMPARCCNGCCNELAGWRELTALLEPTK
eukprot:1070976-Rhodomonas_salina.1